MADPATQTNRRQGHDIPLHIHTEAPRTAMQRLQAAKMAFHLHKSSVLHGTSEGEVEGGLGGGGSKGGTPLLLRYTAILILPCPATLLSFPVRAMLPHCTARSRSRVPES